MGRVPDQEQPQFANPTNEQRRTELLRQVIEAAAFAAAFDLRLPFELAGLGEDTPAGEVDRGTAAVVAQVLDVYLRACSVGLDAQERLEILPRLEELEALVAARKE